ncbi:N-acetylmannosamine-6-phosphate 2-epimerase [Oceaniglobus trochenteri]|uniref:N-acetylmannosamine-6-phosphate 2-epimerase n=1 Tax=Oceaniglobus trochenteri TaxID=2763260 RepID=UPI001CFFAEFE|nr:putative N-acetylmannosamine-6-phosphate 2-epimerase [Oceaniglobus trochenteri]
MKTLPKGALIVSCQARADNPLHGPVHMAAMAQAAQQGGARGLRANGPEDIAAIRAVSDLPMIGIHKVFAGDVPVYITPTLAAADGVMAAGAQIVGLDCTDRPRQGDDWRAIIAHVAAQGCASFADISTLEEGIAAAEAGADYVATTLSGHTDYTSAPENGGPDLALITALANRLNVPIVAEGRIRTAAEVRAALDAGAHAVVVGTAITNPREITRGFIGGLA